jgi:hypothetical protein
VIVTIDSAGQIVDRTGIPDRLAVEQQLQRLQAGLELQSAQVILGQRQAVLDPQPNSAE